MLAAPDRLLFHVLDSERIEQINLTLKQSDLLHGRIRQTIALLLAESSKIIRRRVAGAG